MPGLMLYCCCLEILNTSLTWGALGLHFALGPTNAVADAAYSTRLYNGQKLEYPRPQNQSSLWIPFSELN